MFITQTKRGSQNTDTQNSKHASKKENVLFLAGDLVKAKLIRAKDKTDDSTLKDDYITQNDYYPNSLLPHLVYKGINFKLSIHKDAFREKGKVYCTQHLINRWAHHNLNENTLVYAIFAEKDHHACHLQIYKYKKSLSGNILDKFRTFQSSLRLCLYEEKELYVNELKLLLNGAIRQKYGEDCESAIVCGDPELIERSNLNGTELLNKGNEPFLKPKSSALITSTEEKQKFLVPFFILIVIITFSYLAHYWKIDDQFSEAQKEYNQQTKESIPQFLKDVSINTLKDRQYYLESMNSQNSKVEIEKLVTLLKAIPVLQRKLKTISPTLEDLYFTKLVKSGAATGEYNFQYTIKAAVPKSYTANNFDSGNNEIIDLIANLISNSIGKNVQTIGKPVFTSLDNRQYVVMKLVGEI